MQNTPQVPEEVYGSFCSGIDQMSAQRLINALTTANNGKVKTVHLFFQSAGGTVGDGLALYSFFAALPIELVLYNPGGVFSIATIAYLGAKKRKVSAHAIFGLHRTTFAQSQPATADVLKNLAKAASLDDLRTQALLRSRLNLPADKWEHLNKNDLFFTADEAVKYGIADEIADFSPPAGPLFTV
jgi:ATP-dependent Clp protease protease subunit